ncbi:GTPase IMAP family member 4 [Echria macrotheca]|uniref:GTPase IMAP family member 4 n=1 Tax=Echria macrotheca TaxID=438768 RepID=A0AAJ0F1R2_9PEZI|nr:GTPase IMAP family member 4 [Echria macrotheca]
MSVSGESDNSDVLIALLGLTGAGKTTFARAASGDESLEVGHSIYPCTQEPKVVRFTLDGRRIGLIDTPGFDDDNRSDVEILEAIVEWLGSKGYLKRHRLDGLILLHPITVHRVGGTERQRTRLLKKILGPDAYKRIIIATTMWEQIKDPEDMQRRIDGRKADLWSDFLENGAELVPHENTKDSARKIISKAIKTSDRLGKLKPKLHEELLKNPRVVETTAGVEAKTNIEREIENCNKLLRENKKKEPTRPGKGRSDPKTVRDWEGWSEERQALHRKLHEHNARLKKLNSLSFRFKNWFTKLFL